MYLLDTDHITILDRGGQPAQQLLKKLAAITSSEVATTIITYEEQMRGWLSYIAKTSSIETQVVAYRRLRFKQYFLKQKQLVTLLFLTLKGIVIVS